MKRLVVPAALLLLVASLPTAAHAADLSAICRGDLPVRPGQTLTWRTLPSGGSGDFSYVWSGDVSGTARVESEVYGSVGPKVATVVVTDDVTGQQAQASCLMHVMPNSFVEPPSVTPVLWVPR
ncbi:MAG: hypothetical protein M3P18_01615, partial [Actinomycetota bacterium]|nr:hypothetical protein [Actinomycetota bacterium]